jgi:MFS family permease
MVLALFFFGAGASGINCAFLDVSPRFSSTINTLGNTAGAVAGLLGPIVVSALVTAIDGIWGWRLVFLLTAGMGVASLILWAIYQTSDIVHELNTPATASSTVYNPLLNDDEDDMGGVHDGRPSTQKL